MQGLNYTAKKSIINDEPLKYFSKRMTRLKHGFQTGLVTMCSAHWELGDWAKSSSLFVMLYTRKLWNKKSKFRLGIT